MNPNSDAVLYIGIDPGITGGWAIVDKLEGIVKCSPFESYSHFRDTFHVGPRVCFAVLEQVSSMPRQGVKSMFTFGANYGGWQATLELMRMPYQLITPQRWQKAILGSIPKGESKPRALAYAQRRWPDSTLKKKDHGIVDALCIALYARQLHMGTPNDGVDNAE